MVASAVVGAGVLGAGATVYSANQAAGAAKSAANQANATEQGFFNVEQQNLNPYIQAGNAATGTIANLEGANGTNNIMSTLQSLPGYQFALQQGLKSTQNAASARGLGASGAALKGAATYSTGLSNQYYNNLLTGLQTTATTGANAAAGLASNATAIGNQIGQNTIGAGAAQGAANIATGNALSSAASSVPSALITSNLLQNLQNQGNQGIYAGLSNSNFNDFLNNINTGVDSSDPAAMAAAGVEGF